MAKTIMYEGELLLDLIGGIYDAALDASLWTDVLDKSAHFLGGSAAALFSKDANTKSASIYYDSGTHPHFTQLYFEKYAKLDPATTGQFFTEVEQPIATADLIPYEEFLQTRFYKEWAQPQGLVDFISAVLDKSSTSIAMFGVFRHERDGLANDETRRRMRLIVPHIRRSVLISRLIDLKRSEAASFSDAFDTLSAGMFLVDCEGCVAHSNAAAQKILQARDFLQVDAGKLVATDPEINGTLHDAFAACGCGDAEIGVKAIAVPLKAHDGERYVAHVLPLTSGARRRARKGYPADAALFVRKAELEAPATPEIIAKTYNLTPSELRVLLAIVDVGGAREVAVSLGIADNTVKTHLRRLFEKTSTRRQAELVKLVAGFSNPLRS